MEYHKRGLVQTSKAQERQGKKMDRSFKYPWETLVSTDPVKYADERRSGTDEVREEEESTSSFENEEVASFGMEEL